MFYRNEVINPNDTTFQLMRSLKFEGTFEDMIAISTTGAGTKKKEEKRSAINKKK